MPSPISTAFALALRSGAPSTLAIRARIPPSPSLSARMMKSTNSIETISVIDQKTSEITPKTSPSVGFTA
jgi:hypothetical protein